MSEMVGVPACTFPYQNVPLSWGFVEPAYQSIPSNDILYRVAL